MGSRGDKTNQGLLGLHRLEIRSVREAVFRQVTEEREREVKSEKFETSLGTGRDSMRNFIYGLLVATFLIFSTGTGHGASAGDYTSTERFNVDMSADESVNAALDAGSCTYTISRESETLTYKGGAITLGVTAKGSTSCPAPDISNDLSWVTLTSTFDTTKGTVKLTIPEYGSSILRTGKVTIGGNTFTITQDGEPCSLALSASSSSFPNEGGTGQFTVTATPADCQWTATGSATSSWVAITSVKSGTGTGGVDYTVAANTGKKTRNGKITVETTLNKKSKSYAVKQSTKPILQGNPAFRAAAVAGCQTLGAGVSYPYMALQIASPTGSPIRSLAAASPRSPLRGAGALKPSASQGTGILTFLPALSLWTDSGTLKGDVITVRLYSDAAGKQSAGSLTITLPGITDPADPTNYSIYPAVIKLSVNLTGGNLPCVGNGQITFTGGTGANSMTGTFTLTKDDVVFNLDLALDEQFNVSGSITVVESGATLLLTDVQGALLDTLTCNVTVDPYGWTGHGTINLLTGAMTSSINMETGAATAVSDSAYKLNIIYPDTTGDVVADALVAILTDISGVTATGGTPQSATIDTAFAAPLVVTVTDSVGATVSGATVIFTAPASGASGSFAGGVTSAVTDMSGVATSAVFAANGIAGSYTVTAMVAAEDTPTTQTGFALTNLTTTPPPGGVAGYAYVANQGGTVSQYKIGLDGALTAMSPATVESVSGEDAFFITTDPSGKYAYVVNYTLGSTVPGAVSQFTIGPKGALTPMSPASVGSGSQPSCIAVDPSGKYAYVTNSNDDTVSQYTIGSNGALTPMSTATVGTGSYPSSITVDPSGKYVYVTNEDGYNVYQYTIGSDGALTPMNPAYVWVAPNAPTSITVDPLGNYVYVTAYGDAYAGSVSQYEIGPNGALTPSSNPPAVGAGGLPNSLTIDPLDKYAYVANSWDGTVSQYTIGANGVLSAMTQPTVKAGGLDLSVTVAPSGKYVYVTDGDPNTVSQYKIGSNGALTPMNQSTVGAGLDPRSIVTVGIQK